MQIAYSQRLAVTVPKRLPPGGGKQRRILGSLGPSAHQLPGPVLLKAGLGVQLIFSYTYPGPAEAATNCGSFYTSKMVAQGQSQAAPDTELHQSPSQDAPDPTHPVASFRQHQS